MITQGYLKTILEYNKNTGTFTWKVNAAKNIKMGNIAGSIDKYSEYRYIKINRKNWAAHRLAWIYVYGSEPKNQIDHINGVKDDNRIENLRDVTVRKNQQNRKYHRSGKLVGCYFNKNNKKWQAQIQINKKSIHIGYYNSELEAHEAYAAANWLLSEVEKL